MTKENEVFKDYNDYREWKDVDLYTDQVYLSEHAEYKPEELQELLEGLVQKAKDEGLENCYLKFQSTMEPYEDFLGPVAVTPCGYRKLSRIEKAENAFEDEVEALAKEMGIAIYEARTVLNLKKKGKL